MTTPTQLTLVVTLFDNEHTVGFLTTVAADSRVVAVDVLANGES